MSLFKDTFSNENEKVKEHKGILGSFAVDVIKWEPEDEASQDIIAHRYEYEDFPNGSYLEVAASQMAVFTNFMDTGLSSEGGVGGQAELSVFNGPCKIKLETGDSRFAPFRNIKNKLTGGESAFHSTVYFINAIHMPSVNWGTTKSFPVEDPEEGVNVNVRTYGSVGVHIEKTDAAMAPVQVNKFLRKLVGTRANYTRDNLIEDLRAAINQHVPTLISGAIIKRNIGILKITAYMEDLAGELQPKLVDKFDEFGITLDNFYITSINVPQEDLEMVNQSKIERKKRELEARGNAAAMDIESEARQRMREREGYTYQQEQSFQVMQSAASNEGMSSNLMGAGMGIGMGFGMGGALNQGMQSVVQNATGGMQMQQPVQQAAPSMAGTPCPKCGHTNPAGAKFCLNCGEKMAEEGIACPDCGHVNPAGAKFCLNCGRKLGASVCPNCGKELVPGAKFCLECGTKI